MHFSFSYRTRALLSTNHVLAFPSITMSNDYPERDFADQNKPQWSKLPLPAVRFPACFFLLADRLVPCFSLPHRILIYSPSRAHTLSRLRQLCGQANRLGRGAANEERGFQALMKSDTATLGFHVFPPGRAICELWC